MAKQKKDVDDIIQEPKSLSRKDLLRKAILETAKKIEPRVDRKFNFREVVDLPEIKGELRKCVKDLSLSDKKMIREIMQDLKYEKIFVHVYGNYWAWVDLENQ